MKGKKFLTMAATSLMACLVAGMGAMTYSKYVTSDNTGTQQATAANWGFVVTVNADDLFAPSYNKKADENVAVKTNSYTSGVSVVATSDSKKVVAPGTTGSMTITISGKAEVKAKLTIAQNANTQLQEITLKNYNGTAVNYSPVVWTLTDGNQTVGDPGTLSSVLNELAKTSTELAANTEYSKDYTLTWAWPLETNATNNTYDTIIGYKSYGRAWGDISGYVGSLKETEYADANILTTLAFALDVTIEQIQ